MTGRIVLGLGGTVDYELEWDAAAFQRLVDDHGIHLAEVEEDPPSVVADGRGVVVAILRSMRRARGCECYVEDKEQLLAFGARFGHEVTLGGTCVRAALAMSRIGVDSTVHLVSISDEVRRRLPAGVAWTCSAEEDSLDPHVIVQYPRGASVRLADATIVAGRPNRVILVNDEPNERMVLSRELPAVLREASAVLVSGLNTMKSADELRARLAELAGMLRDVPRAVPVVYEDAGFHDEALRAVVLETVPSLADAHSLNEDEARQYLGRQMDLTAPGDVAAMMEGLGEILGSPTVMVHTSRYAACIGAEAGLYRDAARAGCLMASTRFVNGDRYGRAEYDAVAVSPREPDGLALAAAPELRRAGVLIAPGYDARTSSPTTIGLGDAFIGGVMAHLAARTRSVASEGEPGRG